MKNNSLKLSKEWLIKANNDIKTAEILYKEKGPTDSLCFHCHQSAEKYLKGFLVFIQKKVPRVHDLVFLLNLCKKIDKDFVRLEEEILALNRYYIESRYPSEVTVYSRGECKLALKAAQKISQFIVNKIEK